MEKITADNVAHSKWCACPRCRPQKPLPDPTVTLTKNWAGWPLIADAIEWRGSQWFVMARQWGSDARQWTKTFTLDEWEKLPDA